MTLTPEEIKQYCPGFEAETIGDLFVLGQLAQARKERDKLKQALEHAKTWIEGDQDSMGGEITFNFGESNALDLITEALASITVEE